MPITELYLLKESGVLAKVDWLWLAIGIVFALFILPMIQAWFSARKNGNGGTAQA